VLDVNSFNAALRRFLLSAGDGSFKRDRPEMDNLVMNQAGVLVPPKIGYVTLWLVIDIPCVDDQRRQCRREDIHVPNLDGAPRH
jgi:hypothetical protein